MQVGLLSRFCRTPCRVKDRVTGRHWSASSGSWMRLISAVCVCVCACASKHACNDGMERKEFLRVVAKPPEAPSAWLGGTTEANQVHHTYSCKHTCACVHTHTHTHTHTTTHNPIQEPLQWIPHSLTIHQRHLPVRKDGIIQADGGKPLTGVMVWGTPMTGCLKGRWENNLRCIENARRA